MTRDDFDRARDAAIHCVRRAFRMQLDYFLMGLEVRCGRLTAGQRKRDIVNDFREVSDSGRELLNQIKDGAGDAWLLAKAHRGDPPTTSVWGSTSATWHETALRLAREALNAPILVEPESPLFPFNLHCSDDLSWTDAAELLRLIPADNSKCWDELVEVLKSLGPRDLSVLESIETGIRREWAVAVAGIPATETTGKAGANSPAPSNQYTEAMFASDLARVNSLAVPERPCAGRDHLWALWNRTGLGPAEIRDRWDGLTPEQRRQVAPKACQPIGGRSSEQKQAARNRCSPLPVVTSEIPTTRWMVTQTTLSW